MNNTITANEKQKINKHLRELLFKLEKEHKIKSYISPQKRVISWAILENEKGELGYVQVESWGNFQFSTKHKPNRQTGTGYVINNGHCVDVDEAIELAKIACSALYPGWRISNKDKESVHPYKNFKEYQEKEPILKYAPFSMENTQEVTK